MALETAFFFSSENQILTIFNLRYHLEGSLSPLIPFCAISAVVKFSGAPSWSVQQNFYLMLIRSLFQWQFLSKSSSCVVEALLLQCQVFPLVSVTGNLIICTWLFLACCLGHYPSLKPYSSIVFVCGAHLEDSTELLSMTGKLGKLSIRFIILWTSC